MESIFLFDIIAIYSNRKTRIGEFGERKGANKIGGNVEVNRVLRMK